MAILGLDLRLLDEIKSLDIRLNGKSKTWLNYIKTLLKNLRNLEKGKTISKLIKMAKLYQTLSKNLAKLKVLPFSQIQNEFRQATLVRSQSIVLIIRWITN